MTTYVVAKIQNPLYTKLCKGGIVLLDAIVVGSVIQQVREEQKKSQEVISGLAGIGRTHLSAIERGERRPTLDTFWKISEALNMKPSDLLARIEGKQNKK